jgi:hypothetical protein
MLTPVLSSCHGSKLPGVALHTDLSAGVQAKGRDFAQRMLTFSHIQPLRAGN